MKLGLRLVGGAGFATFFALSVFFFRRPPDPLFEGKFASQWAEELLSPDYVTRNNAQSAFQKLGETGMPYVIELLRRRNHPWEPMIERFNQYVPLYSQKFNDPELCQIRGAEMAGLLGSKGKEAIPELIVCLANDQTASEAERALIRIGRDAEEPLQNAMANKNPNIRQRAAWLLKEFSPAAESTVAILLKSTRDKESGVRKRVAASLGELRIRNCKLEDALLKLMEDRSDEVRAAAITAVGKRKVINPSVRAKLFAALSDEAVTVRLESARAIWKLTGESQAVVPTLISILPTREGWQAAYTLADVGYPASPAVPALVKALKKERVLRPYRTPPSAAFALGHIGPAAIPKLSEVLEDRDARVRISAVMALGFMGREAQPAIPSLLKLLDDREAEVRHTTALTLAAIGAEPEKIVAGLSECLSADDIYMRSAAAEKLREIAPEGNWVIWPE